MKDRITVCTRAIGQRKFALVISCYHSRRSSLRARDGDFYAHLKACAYDDARSCTGTLPISISLSTSALRLNVREMLFRAKTRQRHRALTHRCSLSGCAASAPSNDVPFSLSCPLEEVLAHREVSTVETSNFKPNHQHTSPVVFGRGGGVGDGPRGLGWRSAVNASPLCVRSCKDWCRELAVPTIRL